MAFEGKALDQINKEVIEGLIANEVHELKSLDYKRDAIGNSDNERKEFLADVFSFANASGAFLILGIEATEGIPTKILGLKIECR
jgi:predicted HTH transcriptional regulator